MVVRVAAAGALLLGLLAVPFASGASAQTCDGYTAIIVFVNPSVSEPGGAVTIEGLGTPGETVQATLQSSPPQSLGSAVAGFFGEFEINANLPDPLPSGTYAISVTSNGCPAFELSIVVNAPPAPMVAPFSAGDDSEFTPVPVDDGAPEGESGDTEGSTAPTTAAPTTTETTVAPESTSAGDDPAEVAGTSVATPMTSACGVSEAGRTFLPGQTVSWTLQDAKYDTTRDVRLRLRSGSTIVTLAPIQPWPASNTIQFTVPANVAAGQYSVEQAGYLLSNGQLSTQNCTVFVTNPPAPALSAGFVGENTTLIGALVISALAAAALLQLRIRRLRRV